MADDFDLDDFDLDGIDFDSGDEFGSISSGGEKKNRSPVEKLGRGALEGMKQTAVSPEFRRKLVKESLPDGYGEAYDALGDTVEFGRDLYDTVAKELAPARRGFQKITKRLLPSVEKHLPKSIADKLKAFTEDTDNAGKVDWREAELESQLGNIFQTQMQQQHTLASEAEGRELAKDIITEKRFKSTIDFLDDIRQNISRQTQYQDSVLNAYQRKHLELEYRQLFVSQDHLADFKDFKTRSIDALAAITKNTALPDSIKMRTGEMASYMMRQRLIGDLQEDMSSKLSDYLTGFKDNILKKASEFGKGIADKVGTISDAMDLAADANVDPTETVGSTLGGLVTDKLGSLVAKGAKKLTGNNQSIMGTGSDLQYIVSNAPTLIRDKLESTSRKYGSGSYQDEDFGEPKYDENGNEIKLSVLDRFKQTSGGVFNRMLGLGADLALEVAPKFNRVNDFGVTQDQLTNEALTYNALADKAITQIIPGLLTEILHVNERIATGNDNVEKLTFNYARDEFTRESQTKSDLMQSILPKDKLTNIRGSLQEVIDVIDPNGDMLTARDRNALSKQLIVDMSSGYGFSLDRYLQPEGLNAVDDMESRRNIIAAIVDRFMGEDGKVKNDLSVKEARNSIADSVKSIMGDLPNYQAQMAKLSPLYGSGFFKEMGLARATLTGKTDVNTSGILDYINEQKDLGGTTRQNLPLAKRSTASETNRSDINVYADLSDAIARINANVVDYSEDFLETQIRIDSSNDWLQKIHAILNKWDGGGFPTPPTPINPGPTGGGPGGTPPNQPWNPLDAGKRWLTPNPVISDKFAQISSSVRGAFDNATSNLSDHKTSVAEFLSAKFTEAKSMVNSGVNSIKNKVPVLDYIKSKKEEYRQLVSVLGERGAQEVFINDVAEKTQGKLEDIWKAMKTTFKDNVEPHVDDIQSQLAGVYDINSERVKRTLGSAGDVLSGYKDTAFAKFNTMMDGNLAIDGTKFDSYKQTLLTEVDEIINTLKLKADDSLDGGDVKSKLSQLFGIEPNKEADNDEELMKLTILERVKQKLGKFDIAAKTATLNESMLTGFESMKQWFDNIRTSGSGGDETDAALINDNNAMITSLENLKKEIISLTDATSKNTLAILEDADFSGTPVEQRKKRGFIGNTFGRAGELAVGAGRGALNMGVGLLKGSARLYGKGFGLLGKAVKPTFALGKKAVTGTLSTGRDFAKGLLGMSENVGDIYLEGEDEPIITKRELQKGFYFDKESMKPIKSFKDIKGPVVDGEGNIVISAEDIENKRLIGPKGKSIGSKLGSMTRSGIGMLGRFTATGYGAVFKAVKFAWNLGVKAVKKAFGFITGARDVYVKGETTPRLLKVMMERGLYRDKETGDIINTIRDIKGPVVDTDGNVLITQEDITKGLMGPDGKRLRSALGFAKKAITLPFKLAAKVFTGGLKLGRNILGGLGFGLKRAFRGLMGLPPEQIPHQTMMGVYQSNDILTQIYTLLDKRIPKPEKIRTGGWKDIFSRNKAKTDKPLEKGKSSDANKSIFKGLGKRLGGLFGLGGDDEGGDTYIGGDVDLSRDKDERDKKRKNKKPKGRLARMGGMLKRGAMGLGRLALGAGSLGLGALKLAGGAALGGAKLLGGLALKGLVGLGSILSAPVVLGALAVTAVAVGGYYLYKHFKGKIDGPLHNYRIVQYGLNPENGEHVRRVSAIEEKVMEAVSFDKDTGVAKIGKLSDKALESITKICGVDIKNEAHLTPFVQWLQGRFIPIFVLHLSALRAIDAKIKLNDVDSKLSKEQKQTFLDRTTLKTTDKALYNIKASPFMDEPNLTLSGDSEAQKALDAALADVKPTETSSPVKEPAMVGDVTAKRVIQGRDNPLPQVTQPVLNTPMPDIPVVNATPVNDIAGVSPGGLNAAALGVDLSNRDAEQQTEALLNERKKMEVRNFATKTNADASSLRLVDSITTVAEILNIHTAIHASVDRSLKDIKDLLTDKTADVSTRNKRQQEVVQKQQQRQDELIKAVQQSNEDLVKLKKDLAAEKRRNQQAPSGVVSLDR